MDTIFFKAWDIWEPSRMRSIGREICSELHGTSFCAVKITNDFNEVTLMHVFAGKCKVPKANVPHNRSVLDGEDYYVLKVDR